MITVTKSELPPLEEYVEYLEKIWSSRWLTNNGELLQTLEKELISYLRIKSIIPITNGTIALQVALRAYDLKGEVITTPFTFAATTNVILWEGLTPVFADIDPDTFNIDPEDVERKITDRTCAIMAVHVYGNPCDVERLQEIADRHGIKLIYDAAHAFGIEYKGQSVLNYGDISVLSFHATKVLNTIEGGALVARDAAINEKMKLMVNHGIKSELEVVLPGTNGKMSEFQAAMGLCSLKTINEKIRLREGLYNCYKEGLCKTSNLKFQEIIASRYNYSYMPVLFENIRQRDGVYDELVKHDIRPRKYFYPLTVDFDYYRNQNLVEKYGLHTSLDVSNRVLCLPMYSDLGIENVEKIVGIITGYLK